MNRPTNILLIEDNEADVFLITEALAAVKDVAFDVESAERLSAGLERLAEGDIDVVLLDLALPDSEGFDTFAKTHAQVPQMPIIVLSGAGSEALAVRTVREGAQDYLVKGEVDGHLIARAIRYAIERKRVEETLRERTHALDEQVKKLSCLYTISDLLEKREDIPWERILEGIVNLLPSAWQYPTFACARIVAEGQEFRTENFSETPWKQSSDVVVRGERIGVVEICYLEEKPTGDEGPFLEEERNLLDTVAERLGEIIERKRAQEALHQRNRELTALNRAGHAIGALLDLDQVLTTILEEVRRIMDVVATSIWLVDEETGELVCRQATGSHAEVVRGWRLAPGEGIAGWTARSGESQVVQDVRSDEHYFAGVDRRTGLPLRAILSTPLWAKQRVIGVLQVVDTEVGRFDEQDLMLLEPIAASAAVAVENARLYEAIQQELAERVRAEARTRFLAEVLSSSPLSVIATDEEGKIIYANPATERLFGYTSDELLGENPTILNADPNADEIQGDLFDVIGRGGIWRGEILNKRRNGEVFPVHAAVYQLLDKEGNFIASVGFQEDITERVRSEQERERFTSQLRVAAELGKWISAILDPDQLLHEVVAQSQEHLDLYHVHVYLLDQIPQEKLMEADIDQVNRMMRERNLVIHAGSGKVGMKLLEQGHTIPLDHQPSLVARAARTAEIVSVGDTSIEPDFMSHPLLPDTRSEVAIPLIAGSEVLGVLDVQDDHLHRFTQTDVNVLNTLAGQTAIALQNARLFAERKQAEVALKRRNEELATLNAIAAAIGRSPDLDRALHDALDEVVRLDLLKATGKGAIFLLNEQAGELLAVVQRGFPEDQPCFAQPFKVGECLCGLAVQQGQIVISEDSSQDERHNFHGPETKPHKDVCLPLKARDRVLGALALELSLGQAVTDADLRLLTAIGDQIGVAIESARLVEEAAEVEILHEVNRLRSELIANVSHELRTPLGLIKVLCTTLLREDVDLEHEARLEFLRDIDEETDRLEKIVDNLLDLSRIEGERLHLERQSVDVNQLVGQAIEATAVRHTRHRFDSLLPSPPIMATVDFQRIEQVLRNLLDNAAKYSPEGGAITVGVYGGENQIHVWVKDEGVGIPKEDLERVFERFYRVENEATQHESGAGLGLAVCRGIVEAHGGHIWAESKAGKGSTFHFTLPVEENE